ncbi:MAG TPA: insulinase family protein, partial [Candidatus Nitrosotalea sp.]|nr:insulinase family protein [Candidatus Nitrosotalea sp.]
MKALARFVVIATLATAMPVPTGLQANAAVPVPSVESSAGATIVSQSDNAAPLVGVDIVVRAGLDRQTMKQNGLAALVAQTILRTPVSATSGSAPLPLEEAIASRGGSVHFTVDPSDVRFYLESLPSDAGAIVDLFRTALAAPDFSPATIRDARASLVRQIAQSQQVALQVGIDMLNAASSSQGNTGMPELGTPASLAQLFSNDA